MIKKVGIINYGVGNIMSVTKALYVLGLDVSLVNSGSVKNYDMLILPGVGSFGSAMNFMKKSGLAEQIREFVSSYKPLLGICLGIQLLLTESEEAKGVDGLKIIKGKVKKFVLKKLPVPHICWNLVEFKQNNEILLKNLNKKEYFYFVHSYYPLIEEKDNIVFATTRYGIEFCSMLVKDNIVATQFHLEKSGKKGLLLLKNIIKYFSKL